MSRKTEYFDEIEVSEGQSFIIYIRKQNEKKKALEVNEAGDVIVNNLISKDCFIGEDSIKSEILGSIATFNNLLHIKSAEIDNLKKEVRQSLHTHREALENLCRHLKIDSEIVFPSPFSKQFGYIDPKSLEDALKGLKP